MGSMLTRAIRDAGLDAVLAQALTGDGVAPQLLERLRRADLLLVAGLADAVRKAFRGDEVRLVSSTSLGDSDVVVFDPALAAGGGGTGPTGAELLREIALARLRAPGRLSLAVSIEALGIELAQTALVFGADVLFGDLGGKRTLPLLDGPEARRAELRGLIERSGRRLASEPPSQPALEQRS